MGLPVNARLSWLVNLGLWFRVDSIVALPRYFRSIEVHQGSIVVRVNAIIELSQVTILSQRLIVIEWPLYFAIVAQQSIVIDKYKSGFMDLIMKFSRLVPLIVQVPFFCFQLHPNQINPLCSFASITTANLAINLH